MLPELAAAPRTSRYEIHSLLGRGASGLVYRAFDLQQHLVVALKSLRFLESEEIYYLKNEFRSLSTLSHPNLVQLYELDVTEEHCFFTMELIEGVSFLEAVRSSGGPRVDYQKLRSTLAQLADGLLALHAAGKLHRDIKPTNVIVSPDARTVLVDFGLSQNVATGGSMATYTRALAGTPAYMAPERLAGLAAVPASDWFSVGVMLYEALTGQQPFAGDTPVMLYEAQKLPPIPPGELIQDTPPDLNDIATALLSPEPSNRPGGDDVYDVTGSEMRTKVVPSPTSAATARTVFVGRGEELDRLQRSFDQVQPGRPMVMFVEGVSGVGKTALIETFLRDAQIKTSALVLRSRCHYQETIRYKALDGLVDNLTRNLLLEDSSTLAELTPSHITSLVKAFPVLERVEFETKADEPGLAADPQVILQRAIEAFRDLVRRLSERRALVLWIDDVQWSDVASARMIDDLLHQPNAPGVFLVLTFRSEDKDSSEVLTLLRDTFLRDVTTETIELAQRTRSVP